MNEITELSKNHPVPSEDESEGQTALAGGMEVEEESALSSSTPMDDRHQIPTFAFGVPSWKESLLPRFPDRKFVFISRSIPEEKLTAKFKKRILADPRAEIFLWGIKAAPHVLNFIMQSELKCTHIEDGFIHSIGPVTADTPPLSLVLDSRTPHYDSTNASDLECLLNEYDFAGDEPLLERADRLMASITKGGLSRYNHAALLDIESVYGPKEKRRILVLGEAESDAAIEYGSRHAYTNEDVVGIAATENPDAQIIFKPCSLLSAEGNLPLSIPDHLKDQCLILEQNISVAQALETIDHVYTITAPEGFEALMRGIKATTLGCPFYSGWGLTDDRQPNERRQRRLTLREVFAAAYILYPKYYDAEDTETTPEIFFNAVLEKLRAKEDEAQIPTFMFGARQWSEYFASWFPKRRITSLSHNITVAKFTSKFRKRILRDPHAEILVWGSDLDPEVMQHFAQSGLKCTYAGEGFIGSIGPPADDTPPLSLVIDNGAFHFDASRESDLECLLNNYDFTADEELIVRADRLISTLLETGLSKYNHAKWIDDIRRTYGLKNQRRVLVLGQLEDDAPAIHGGERRYTNSDLVRIAAAENPDAQIIYKPYPKLFNKQSSNLADVKDLCLVLELDLPIAQALQTIDHVYTVSSLAGFEALMRGIKVTTLGCPFYAGWGLTDDRLLCVRRRRKLTLRQVFGAAYVLYSKYFDPLNKQEITPEIALEQLKGSPALPVRPTAAFRLDFGMEGERKKKATGGFGRIKRILITSDFLMTKEKEQESNRRWMFDLLRRPIRQATGIGPISFSSSLTDSQRLSRSHFFELSDIEVDINATQFWFDDAAVTSESLDYLAHYLGPGDLVVGYELSEQTRRLLDYVGVPWVDIWLHPIRFLDDILFAFSASERSVYQEMQSFNVAEDVFYLYADRIRIQCYKGYRRSNVTVEPGTALFIGQTLEDKAVCRRGKMLNLLHFKKPFERAGAEYGHVSYSRHPYVRSGDEAILKYVNSCGFAQVVDYPAYHLLASGKIAKAFSISSSVVYEAKYFGLRTEFLFKPVIRFGDLYGKEHLSIYQEFVSPHFWAQALRPIMPTNNCNRVMYLEGKDKLRDMLNFYWSYRNVDKAEDVRQRLLAVDKKVQSFAAPRKKHEPVKPGRPFEKVVEEVRALMAKHEVITFDVFDTLIARPFEKPEDLFDYMAAQVHEVTGGAILDFRKARLEARGLVTEGSHGEEVTLDERYLAMAAHHGLPVETAERMMEMEKAAEMRLCRRRECGWKIYRAAMEMGKQIAFVSDTYFSGDFVSELLRLNGYETTHPIFLSSEYGKLKHTGSLFPEVADGLGASPDSILHIGDNLHADVKMAQKAGFSAFHLSSAIESFKSSRLSEKMNFSHPVLGSIIRGLIANRLTDNPWGLSTPSCAGGERDAFGYTVAGPIFFGFAKWTLEQALKDGVDVLYFLSRDGDIVKRCYDILAQYYPEAPKSVYLRASRRGVNVPALETEEDILNMLEANFSPCPVGDLLRNRFGMEDIPLEALESAGYKSSGDIVDYKRDAEKVRLLLLKVAPDILLNAQTERQTLLAYFAQQGLMEKGARKAIVDIGHHGTLQASIARLIADPALGGYYFVTDKEIEQHVHALGMPASGYLADCIDMKEKRHPYSCNLLMFEAIFLNGEGSFIRMVRRDGELEPEFLPVDKEAARICFISKVHDAATEFTRDVAEVLGAELPNIPLDGNDAASGYIGMLADPTYLDACMFDGIAFENVYSGRDSRCLIQVDVKNRARTLKGSLWKEGAEVIISEFSNTTPN